MDYKFQRTRIDKIPKQKILDELEEAAKIFHYTEFGWRDFDKVASISAGTVKNEFGSWKKALFNLKVYLNKKGIDLLARPFAPNRTWTDKDMFDEMERIWHLLNHRPSRNEWELSESKISYGTYTHRFNGWQNACLKFIEHKMGGSILLNNEVNFEPSDKENKSIPQAVKDSRTIALGVRLKVLDRDNFRCVLCGRSPATDLGIKLHIDHKIPFSQGGASTVDNLQTLCQECNLGKSDSFLGSR